MLLPNLHLVKVVENNVGLSTRSLKTAIRTELTDLFEARRQVQISTSRNIYHHSEICKVKHVYGESNKISRLHDGVTARLRLDYRYYWRFGLTGGI